MSEQRTTATLIRTEDLEVPAGTGSVFTPPALTLFLYKVNADRTMRAAWSAVGSQDGRAHLPLELHFLITPWAGNANHELSILGRAMQCLDETPILSGPLLDSLGAWSGREAIQVCLEDLSTEDLMRTFDSLPADYKVSVSYSVKIIRVDGQTVSPDTPVVAVANGITPSSQH